MRLDNFGTPEERKTRQKHAMNLANEVLDSSDHCIEVHDDEGPLIGNGTI